MGSGRIGVVGAGLAGLSAALALKQQGFEVELLERSRLLGGKATSFRVGDVEVDNGQHVYLGCCTEFIDFAAQLGYTAGEGGRLFLQDRFEALLLARGRPPARLRAVSLPAPLHLAPALLRYRYVGLRSRLRIARALLAARRTPNPGETFAGWLGRHGQTQEERAAFWDPFLVPALNARLEEVDAEAGTFVISTAFLGNSSAARFGFACVPLARLAEEAAGRLDRVLTRTPVAGIEVTADGVDILSEGGSRLSYDAAILAVPPERLERILGDPEAMGVSGLGRFQTAPIVDVHLWYDLPDQGFGFAAVLDSPVQWVFEKGPGYLCCSMSAAGQYVGRPSTELVELCHRELAVVLPALRNREPVHGAATRDRDATFIPSPGLHRPGPATAYPQLAIAGAWTDTGWPATMESAVRSGRAAAATIAGHLRGRAGHA